MLQYNGMDYKRLYLPTKDKRLAWETYMKGQYWVCDLSDLKETYMKLFINWDNPKYWESCESFLDDHY